MIRQSTWQRIILLAVLGYEGLGALLGGSLLIAAPDGQYMEMPVEIMHGVFSNFLIPGLILMSLGILASFAFFSVLRRCRNDWIMASIALGGFTIWFVVEIIILRDLHWLHLIWGVPVLVGAMFTVPLVASRNYKVQNYLLLCGTVSSLWYIAINIIMPMYYEGYSIATFTVSELSAIGAPTRILWVLLALAYPLLFSAFGWGVLFLSKEKRLRTVGYLILAYSFFNIYWPPMHMRGVEHGITDTLHIVWALVTNMFMWAFMILGAAALGKKFRIYTIISIILHLIFGILTTLEAPNIPTNGPTPMIGIWERINILIFMIWVGVFSTVLAKNMDKSSSGIGNHDRNLAAPKSAAA